MADAKRNVSQNETPLRKKKRRQAELLGSRERKMRRGMPLDPQRIELFRQKVLTAMGSNLVSSRR